MGDTWNTLTFLGGLPHFHADPAEHGVPLVSVDGHWWWDGAHWTPRASEDDQLALVGPSAS